MEKSRKQILRPDQKNVALMKYLVQKLSKPGGLVLHAFSGTFPTAIVCILLDKRRGFVSCNKDSGYVGMSMTGFVEVYAFQLPNIKSDLNGGQKWIEAARLYLSVLKTQSKSCRWTTASDMVCRVYGGFRNM